MYNYLFWNAQTRSSNSYVYVYIYRFAYYIKLVKSSFVPFVVYVCKQCPKSLLHKQPEKDGLYALSAF
jgi:hypothetical protein